MVTAQSNYCFDQATSIEVPELFLVKHLGNSITNKHLNKELNEGLVKVDHTNNEKGVFEAVTMVNGDCIQLNEKEIYQYQVQHIEKSERWYSFLLREGITTREEKSLLVPIVLYKAIDQSRQYGLIRERDYKHLNKIEFQLGSHLDLINFPLPHDLTVLYVLCESSREKPCELRIKKGKKWISKNITVFARSRRENPFGNKDSSFRIGINGDTPQGVYHLWATLFTENPAFGNIHRLDMDATFPPLNGHAYEINNFLLEKLAPKSMHKEYWIQEWPLAFNLGRNHIRLHDNNTNYQEVRQTDGCINTNRTMDSIIKILLKHKIISKDSMDAIDKPERLNWKVIQELGKVFVIVKDKN